MILFRQIWNLHAGGNPRIEDADQRACDANLDRVTLVVNSAEAPVTIKVRCPGSDHPHLDYDSIWSMIASFALACDNATPLCLRGGPIGFGLNGSMWLQLGGKFLGDDKEGVLIDKSAEIVLGLSHTDKGDHYFIRLGLQFLNEAEVSPQAIERATLLTSSLLDKEGTSGNSSSGLSEQQRGDLYEIKLGVLAIILDHQATSDILGLLRYVADKRTRYDHVYSALENFDDSMASLPPGDLPPDKLDLLLRTMLSIISHFFPHEIFQDQYWEERSKRPRKVVLDNHFAIVMAHPDCVLTVPDPLKGSPCANMSRCWELSAKRSSSCHEYWIRWDAQIMAPSPGFVDALEALPPASSLSKVYGPQIQGP